MAAAWRVMHRIRPFHSRQRACLLSTAHPDQSYQQQLERNLSALGGAAYSVPADSIQCLASPADFHKAILEGIRSARTRVHISALYLGTDALSLQIVEALRSARRRNPELRVQVLLDCLRATRTERNTGDSSVTALLPLIGGGDDRREAASTGSLGSATVGLFHSPQLSGALKKMLPERWNETVSLLHMKALVFDDQLIITGANLSHEYFVNRQDRYVVFSEAAALAEHFATLIDRVSSLSHSLQPCGALLPPSVDPAAQPAQFREQLRRLVGSPKGDGMPTEWRGAEEDTVVYPTVQFGPANMRHDEAATLALLHSRPSQWLLNITTGYFNCTKRYEQAMQQGGAVEVWVAAPSANGFFTASGAASLIPRAYSLLAEQFHGRVCASRQIVAMREWAREGWTFHGKGLWLGPKDGAGPIVTVVGSPNFGERSVHRDLEASVIVVTTNKGLRERLAAEQAAIREHTSLVTQDTFDQAGRFGDEAFDQPSARRGLFMKLVTRLCKGFL